MRSHPFSTILLVTLTAFPAAAQWDVSGDIGFEFRTFPESSAWPGQDNATVSPSISVQPEFIFEWNKRNDRLTFEPFLRLDADDNRRSHFDLRQASYLHLAPTWDILIGASRVFWGVTESVHLVDIINQTDGVEDIDTEDKLGQPMINLNLLRDSGAFGFFVLPGFRERTFPGDDARRRGPLEIDGHDASYDSGARSGHVDYALRWSHILGNWDIGISNFYGTSREPRLKPKLGLNGKITLRPHYDIINQLSLDLQLTKDAWLWKLEAISRWGHGGQFFAAVAGFEYTLFQIGESQADLGILAEFQYDGRDTHSDAPLTVSDNDIFVGARLALNDESSTAILAGLLVDVTNGTTGSFIEAERRLSDHWKFEFEARLFLHSDEDDPAFLIRKDDSLTFRMTYSF